MKFSMFSADATLIIWYWTSPIQLALGFDDFLLDHDVAIAIMGSAVEFTIWLFNSLPWKITMLLRTVNHLFLWAIYTMAMLVITRGYINTNDFVDLGKWAGGFVFALENWVIWSYQNSWFFHRSSVPRNTVHGFWFIPVWKWGGSSFTTLLPSGKRT